MGEAWNDPDREMRNNWENVIKKEFENMEKNDVWDICDINEKPENPRLLGAKWIFKVKKNGVFKARLVAQGFTQILGVDHQNNLSPIIYETTYRIVLTMWAMYGWSAKIKEIETAFLYKDLGEEIYLMIPKGYREYRGENLEGKCLLLRHAIYGLGQAAQQFFKKMKEVLETKLGFRKCMNDQCLYIKKNEEGVIVVCLYIDDILCVGNQNAIEKFNKDIEKFFVTKEEGEMTEYVGCMISKNQDTVTSNRFN